MRKWLTGRRFGMALVAAGMVGAVALLPGAERSVAANSAAAGPTPLPLIVVNGAPTPAPVVGPRLDPPAIPNTDVLLPVVIYNQLLTPPSLSSQEANAAADAQREAQEAQGRGITTATSSIASGITLFAPRTTLLVTYLAVPVTPPAQAAAPVNVAPVASGMAYATPQVGAPAATIPPNPAAALPPAPVPTATTPGQAAVTAPSVEGPRTILSPARLGLPSAQPGPLATPTVGIPDPGQPLAVRAPGQMPAASMTTVPLQAGFATPTVEPLPAQTGGAPEAAPGIPSAHSPPVIVVEPGASAALAEAEVRPVAPPVAQVVAQVTGPDIACNDFNRASRWASQRQGSPTDMWSDWYAGWGPFAVNQGFYQARNVTFSLESAVGPGSNAGPNEHSAKIASNQPYAAGFGSPLFGVPPGALITVSVNYLIFDHDDHGYDYDWVSLGVKPDAYGSEARYVNGYARGQWSTMTNSVVAGPSGRIMVLLQGESPGAINSNVYFDNVRIWIDGAPVVDCTG